MEAYSGFAYVYDRLMENVDYDGWVAYIEKIFERNDVKPINMAELACGTGNLTNRLAMKEYNLIGVDISQDMLSVAADKAFELGADVIYLNHDMRYLTLPTELDAILCVCDGINYVLKDEDLLKVFQSVYNHLKDEGLFIFDISSYYKISTILGENTFGENLKDVSYIWENYFDEERAICEFDLTIFTKEGHLYRKHVESHSQRAYKEREILEILHRTPFKKIEVFEAFTFSKPKEDSERIYFICQK